MKSYVMKMKFFLYLVVKHQIAIAITARLRFFKQLFLAKFANKLISTDMIKNIYKIKRILINSRKTWLSSFAKLQNNSQRQQLQVITQTLCYKLL